MATTGTIIVDYSTRDQRGAVLSIGRIKVGQNATIDAADFQMRTLKSVVLTPWPSEISQSAFVPGSIGSQSTKNYRRSFFYMAGSIGSLNTLNNYIRVKAFMMITRGSFTQRGTLSGVLGTWKNPASLYIGTQPGSMRASYVAVGR